MISVRNHATWTIRRVMRRILIIVVALAGIYASLQAQDEVIDRPVKVDTIPFSVTLERNERPLLYYGKSIAQKYVRVFYRMQSRGAYALDFTYVFAPPPPDPTDSLKVRVGYCVYYGQTPLVVPADTLRRLIQLDSIGQRELVRNGECVTVQNNTEDSYVRWTSHPEGYELILTSVLEKVFLSFNKMCQTEVVLNPAMVDISIDSCLRLEQVIWTPRSDQQWEVRIGTMQRGCESDPAEKLPLLRSAAGLQYEECVNRNRITSKQTGRNSRNQR